MVIMVRKVFYHLPESVKMGIIKTINNVLLYFCSRR